MIPQEVRDVPVVRLGAGRVLVGSERSIPAEGVVVPVVGAHLTVDPARPHDVPSCLITEGDVARDTLVALFGEDAAAAIARVWPEEAHAETTCVVTASEELQQVVRLAVARWCRRFSPLRLDEIVLWAEELTLVGCLRSLLEDEDDWAEDLDRAVGWLIDSAGGQIRGDGPVEQLILEALEVLATRLPVTDPISVAARERLARYAAPVPYLRALDPPSWWENDLGHQALTAGTVGGAVGVDTVDWNDVPRGVTSMAEGNATWTLKLDPFEAEISVTVEGPVAVRRYGQSDLTLEAPALERLAFDAYVPDWPLPVLTGGLRFDAAAWSWRGSVPAGKAQAGLIQAALAARQTVSVRVRSLRPVPFRNPARAQAHRWTCRGISLARVATDTEQRATAVEAVEHAADLWAETGRDAYADECRRLAADWADGRVTYDLTVAEKWLTE